MDDRFRAAPTGVHAGRRGPGGSPSMADDRVVPADRALPRQQAQWDHPGSTLSFASGSAIKRVTAGVKARRGPFSGKVFDLLAGPSLRLNQFRTKKEYSFTLLPASLLLKHWPVIADNPSV